MISRMAMTDIETLRSEGLDVSPRDVVRLNALGLKVERAARAAEFVAVPRLAFLGDISFREPTIGDEEWLAIAGQSFNLDDCDTETLVLAACLSTPFVELPDPRDRRAVMKLLKRFRRGPVRRYTCAQLVAALEYAMYGDDASTGELPPPRGEEPEKGESAFCRQPLWVGVLRDGIALRLGTAAELRALTASQLHALVQYACELKADGRSKEAARSSALGDYLRTLDEVRARSKAERGGSLEKGAHEFPGGAVESVAPVVGGPDRNDGQGGKYDVAEDENASAGRVGVSGTDAHDGESIANG